MSLDRPRRGDVGRTVPRVSEDDPLPGGKAESQGRWGEPYISEQTDWPTVATRRPLTVHEVVFGLQSCLSAETFSRLTELMAEQDELAAAYNGQRTAVRNTL